MIRQLLYTSKEYKRLSFNDIGNLLVRARSWNYEHGITGLLLHAPDGHFVQLIEGKPENIDELFSRIKSDDRHGDIEVVIDQGVEARAFQDWEMGFADLLCADQMAVENYINDILGNCVDRTSLQLIPVFKMALLHDSHANTSLVPSITSSIAQKA